MKKYLLVLLSAIFLSVVIFAQEAAQKPATDSTSIYSKKQKPNTDVHTAPKTVNVTETLPESKTDTGIEFGLAGLLLGSLQNWNDLQTDGSKLGFGMSGDLLAGIKWDDMYIGIGPHLGYNFWTYSKTLS